MLFPHNYVMRARAVITPSSKLIVTHNEITKTVDRPIRSTCAVNNMHIHTAVGEKQTEDALDTIGPLGWANRFLLARSSLYTVDGRR